VIIDNFKLENLYILGMLYKVDKLRVKFSKLWENPSLNLNFNLKAVLPKNGEATRKIIPR